MAMNFYWGSGSTPCRRVHIVLEEKGVQYASKLLEFSKGEHKSPELLKLNPRGQLPVLQDKDTVINESLGAMLYLEETYSTPSLMPKDTAERAMALQRLMESGELLQVGRSAFRMKMMGQVKTEEDEKVFNENLMKIKAELVFWEGYLAGKQYLAGDTFTLADASVGSALTQLWRMGATYENFPNLKKYREMLEERASFVASFPPHYKESAGKDWLAPINS